jgi:hypothetical protein
MLRRCHQVGRYLGAIAPLGWCRPHSVQWKPKKSTEAQFSVNVPDTLADLFFMEKDSKRFPETGGWGYAQFDYEPTSATFSADKAGTPGCGQGCHVTVKAKDYVFHPYEVR